ncbi:GSCOCG00000931001-RA-CDS [Cotesia congregata]|uniref:Probable RNA polymerase II nuclear localization protein SLC7A6OS n=1 Tax=Cotesia congregata TaxID=51543 RepID=A0A8J2HL26_COTCN|nr:GSCOCG00000931001-RA-CDS [Cotesia congregata]CAG5095788.1 Similar to SLC7A6OS: Probable RNA polymerase II nuclear localization protein SLC7A6OS (Bos taurus) [Cotesia congregata]
MTTILRVKRRNSDEPLDALIIACKKRKVDAEAAEVADPKEPLKTVVKFAGTVQNQEVNAAKEIAKTLTTSQLKANYKQHSVDVLNKTRTQKQEDSRENRYKFVNCFREIESSDTDGKDNDLSMTLIDVEDSVSCTKKAEGTDLPDCTEFVFDVYCIMENSIKLLDDSFTIEPYNDEMVFDEKYRENGEFSEDDSEDSNCESNWKNDYPDSDDYHSEGSIGVEDMEQAVSRMWLHDGQSDLSDDEYDNYIYHLDNSKYTVDDSDIEHYGLAYAQFKAKLKNKKNDDDDDDEESDDDDCDNDSDDSNYSGVLISEIHSDEEGHDDND